MTSSCPICQEHQKNQTPETLHPHEIPTQPWEVLGADLFEIQGTHYLLIADYFSKFFVCRKTPRDCTSQTIITIIKQVFAERGIPKILFTDNGPQFAAKLFQDFVKQWSFDHITSSPIYPKSNGFIERQVQTVKKTLIKALQDGKDLDLTLLCLRTTPISPKIPSPLELMTGRKPRSNLPTRHMKSPTDELVREQLQERQDLQKVYHDRKANDLPLLNPGQHIRFQDHPSSTWKEGVVTERLKEPRSYLIETPTSKLRRNRVHIRNSPEEQQQTPKKSANEPPRSPNRFRSKVSDSTPANNLENTAGSPPILSEPIAPQMSPTVRTSRYGREIKMPARYE